MNELVIRGGTVVDGSGAAGVRADIGIADGRITEVGTNLKGDRTLDIGRKLHQQNLRAHQPRITGDVR